MGDPIALVLAARRGSVDLAGAVAGAQLQGPPGPKGDPGVAVGNIDGGYPDTNYTGIYGIDCGGVTP